ncbi:MULTISPECIES: Wzz/FepE/Etk N-terminal domain-containing protein [Streptomyces]|uniref:Polysaccharide biosynthesis protein n=1 Tax=Streptomyces koelreuteriae TaxID=2838015 RepID=A0ABX8G134_9ACTN|nr:MULTISPECIES: Wzz/FepE/Etk N-terminal domain-containing protein [Streptomyces]QWB27056.1 polysaccharide biosynthesis protein [Streptomyces koelreuteriae]UUA10136.1 Wzz/FepE/Etk N-terminal domain-containing protein [Streptomyces koelreuteriae]UUA17742.1 Wzz/FepE/Etk N-terminal domain-containing protein [Streptomyces sp. CRCS-T-1]
MNDETIRLVTIGRIIRRRARLLLFLAVLGALVGLGTSLLFPPRYTTSASVLLPGAWEERELLTQAQIASSSVVVDRAAAALGWDGVDGGELRDRVSAEAADGNIIEISGTADTPQRAQRLSDQVAQQFVAFAARIAGEDTDSEAAARPEALRQLVVQTSRRITELADAADPGRTVESVQTRTELAKLRTTLQEAMKKLDEADPAAGKANMVVMGPAARPDGEAPPTRTQLVVGGALLFFLLAVIGHLTAARMSSRLRGEPEIAAALGSAPLGTVDVPAEPPAHRPEDDGPRARIRRLLGVDVRWDLPSPQTSGDEAGMRLRYRRVCARLRERVPSPRELLVVVPDGDETAHRAAGQLVAEAEGDPRLRVVRVSVSQPVVPDRGHESGALVVLSAGSRTAGELSGIAEACADARHEVVGIVLVGTVRARPARSAGRPRDTAAPALAVGDGTAGGSV